MEFLTTAFSRFISAGRLFLSVVMVALVLPSFAGAQSQTVVYQDDFGNDTRDVNAGIGGGIENNTILRHRWDDDGDLSFNGGNANFRNRAIAFSMNSFQSNEGFELSVNYSLNNQGGQLGNLFGFGLIREDTDLSAYAGLNPFGNVNDAAATSVYSIGVNILGSQGGIHAGRGLNFTDGNGTAASLDVSGTNQQFLAGSNIPVVIRVVNDGGGGADFSYTIDGIIEATGNIPIFDFSQGFHFATYAQDNERVRSIQSVSLATIDPEPEPEPEPEPVPVPDPVFMVVDQSAVGQLIGSAIPSNMVIGQIASQVHGTGLRDLNKRIFRLRNRLDPGNGGFAQTMDAARGREVSAARIYRMEKQLNVQSTINLNGPTKVADHDATLFRLVETSSSLIAPSMTVPAGDVVQSSLNRLEAYASFDYGYFDLDQLGRNAGVQSRTYAGTVGVEHVVTPSLAVGLGFTRVQNENELSGGLGDIDLEGNAVSGYASYFKNNLWGDFLYSYGDYEASINRNTLLGSTVTARPNVESHQTTLNLGYNMACDDRFNHGPTFRADYSWGQLEGYTEKGDPRANTIFRKQDYESLITTLGYQVNWRRSTSWGCMLPQFRLGYGRELNDRETNVSGTLQNSPIAFVQGGNVIGAGAPVTNTLNREDAGEGWLEFGAGMGFDFHNDFSLTVDYRGRFFQQDAQLHQGTVKATWRF